jgi:hypothetical protein
LEALPGPDDYIIHPDYPVEAYLGAEGLFIKDVFQIYVDALVKDYCTKSASKTVERERKTAAYQNQIVKEK